MELFAKIKINPKIPKTCANLNLFFGSIFISRFEQWEFFNGLIFNFLNAKISDVDSFTTKRKYFSIKNLVADKVFILFKTAFQEFLLQ